MSKNHYVIVGSGAAGSNAAFRLKKLEPKAQVTVLSDEAFSLYQKMDLANYLCGQVKKKSLFQDYPEKFVKAGIQLRLSQPVIKIDAEKKQIFLAHKETLNYSKLLLATGVHAVIHPKYRPFSEHLTLFNCLEDVVKLKMSPEVLEKPLILGGSLTGVRLALALSAAKKPVKYLLFKKMTGNLLAGADDFSSVKNALNKKNIQVLEDVDVRQIKKMAEGGYQVTFTDGHVLDSSVVFAAFGVAPNIGLAKEAGLDCDLGILVNKYLETSHKDIYAAGDIAQIFNPKLGDYWVNFGWPNAVKQGKVVADNMSGKKKAYDPTAVNVFAIDGAKIKFKNWQ